MAIAQLVFFTWVILAKKYSDYRPRFKGITLFLAVFLTVISVSALFGVNPSLSFWSKFERMTGVLMWIHLFGFYLAVSTVMEKKDWLPIFGASAGLGFAMGLLALIEKDPGMRGGGTFGNDSFLGTYLLINTFLAVYIFFTAKKESGSKWLKIFSGSSFLALVYFLFKSQANAAQISFIGGIVLFICLWLATNKKKLIRLTGFVFVALVAIGSVIAIVLATRMDNFVYRAFIGRLGENALNIRLVVWKIAYEGFVDRPLLGYGPENFEYAFIKHYNPCLGTGSGKCGISLWFDRAHNVIFDTLATTGMLGLVAYIGVFLSALFFLWKGFFNNKIGFPEAGAFTALLAAYFVQNLTVFDTVASLMLLMLALAFITSMLAEKKNEKKEGSLSGIFVIAVAIAFLVCFTQFIVNPVSSGHSVIIAIKSPFGSVVRLDNYQKTLYLSPMGRYQVRQFFAQTFLNEEKKGKMPLDVKNKELEALSSELQKSVDEVPQDYKAYYMLSQLYAVWSAQDPGKIALCEATSQKMVELSPANQKGYWLLAQARLYQNRPDDAYDLAKQALDLDPGNYTSQAILEKIEAVKNETAGEK